jgi:hypothetical protein
MSAESYVQVATDGPGKRVDAYAVTLPAGSIVTNADGTTTTLTADTVVYRQGVAIADPSCPGPVARVTGEAGRGAVGARDGDLLGELASMHVTLRAIHELLLEIFSK